MKYFIALILLCGFGCNVQAFSKPPIKQKESVVYVAPSPTVIVEPGLYVAAWDGKAQGKLWTQIVSAALDELGKDMLLMEAPLDASKYCPGFAKAKYEGRKQCFIGLISSMAFYESGFDPAQTYTEGFNDAQGKKVISRGLLQMSIESARSYKCEAKTAQDLHDPKIGLRCGVIVLNRWIYKDKYIGSKKLGGARYWSVLRDTSKSQAKVRAKTMGLSK